MKFISCRIKMAAWSSVLCTTGRKLLQNNGFKAALVKNAQGRYMSDHRTMDIRPSRYQWHKTKDWFHFYFMLGIIPVSIGLTLLNVFIGPATLTEIPEGYVPKEWEYHQHPLKRFFQRYLFPNPQEIYERNLHYIYVENEVRKIRLLQQQIEEAMGRNRDFRGPFFTEGYGAKYLYSYRKSLEEVDERNH